MVEFVVWLMLYYLNKRITYENIPILAKFQKVKAESASMQWCFIIYTNEGYWMTYILFLKSCYFFVSLSEYIIYFLFSYSYDMQKP